MNTLDISHNFFNFSNNKVVYDERNKRFIYVSHANKMHKKVFNKNVFKHQRPDLQGNDQAQWFSDFRDGQAYLRSMMYMNKMEMRRLWRILGANSYMYVQPLMTDYMKQYKVDSPRINRLWTWKDASKIVEYFRDHQTRANKYGLNNVSDRNDFSKASIKRREDELVEYFLHEMRKKPVE